ncbi:bifunctional 4-hydroxy-2-oxoglutarate aldolase/2-dehydro-3-deoxy-phosphogluconate aldolase [Arthrobacter rhizosphaerae]|uniref:bifunctional 4-hydroxy-2-oxoglutarate aldolase/2-dehydro-3-deoxy-phosphogluconate aldolase n=1 Tax=Arthrobacter rhizosphaerae TaxID=2855490 RepID=UPI001FF53144|nr:bifunctional 4-hydroxy-2-oxoglutarate aldolase/2-dehydro-3-deoxy-phosphogluconate aldolase [Arthrobacter rhizosphaerae]
MKTETEVISTLGKWGVIPVVVIDDAANAVPLLTALSQAGLPMAEITFRTPAGAEAIRAVVDAGLTEGPAPVLIGAGTVTTVEEVDTAVDAGAQFIVSPGFSRSVVERCQEHGVTIVPGAVTATEILACLEMGLQTVKFFPASVSGGPSAVQALLEPFGSLQVIPTGGINPDNLSTYLTIPNVVAAGGSWMVPRAAIQSRDFVGIGALSEQAVALAMAIRQD